MRGRERLLRAFHQLETDRIPVAPFIHVNFVKEFFSDRDADVVAGTVEVYRHFGFDLMHRNCSAAYDHFAAVETEDWRVEKSVEHAGRDETATTVIRTPEGELRRVTATRWIHEYECESSVVEYPIKAERDLELCRRYMPAVGTVDTRNLRRARELVGDEGIVAPWVQGFFNELAIHYRKLDDLLLDALLRPDFYSDLADFAFARLIELVRQNIDAGADVLSAGGNVASGKIVGPAFFGEHIAPREQRLVRYVQDRAPRFSTTTAAAPAGFFSSIRRSACAPTSR